MMHNNVCHKVVMVFLIIGGLNWGLVGLGTLIGSNLNVVNLLLGSVPYGEAIVFLLIGLAALNRLVYVSMGKCTGGTC